MTTPEEECAMGFMDKFEQSVVGYREKIGGEVVVNVDPDDPNSMLLWG